MLCGTDSAQIAYIVTRVWCFIKPSACVFAFFKHPVVDFYCFVFSEKSNRYSMEFSKKGLV